LLTVVEVKDPHVRRPCALAIALLANQISRQVGRTPAARMSTPRRGIAWRWSRAASTHIFSPRALDAKRLNAQEVGSWRPWRAWAP